LTRWKVTGVNIEDDILKEVLKFDLFGVGVKTDQLGNDLRFEDDPFDDVNDAVMVIFEEGPKLPHLHKVNLLFLHLPLKSETVLKDTELPHQLQSLLVVLLNASGNLTLLLVMVRVHSSISWSN